MTKTENQSEQHTTWSLFRRLWRDWVRQHIGRLILIFVFMMMISALSGAYPVLIGYVFNGLNEASHNLIWQIPALIIGIAAIRSAAMYGLAKQLAVLSLLVTRHIQKQIASHVIMADLGDIMSQPSGTFVSRMTNDVNIIREALVRLINNLIKDSLTIIVLIGVLISFDWMLTLIVLGIYPLAMQPIIRIGRRQRHGSREWQEHLGQTTSTLNETMKGGRMIRAYGLEDYERSRTGRMFDLLFQSQRILAFGRAKIDPILEVLGGIAIAGIVGFAGWRVLSGSLDIGHVAGFITALLMLAQPVRAIGTLNTILQEAGAALARLYILLDTPSHVSSPEQPEVLDQIKGRISFESVSFQYAEDITLSDITFSVEPGQTLALVGPSGGGKSTIINLIPRLYDPTEGNITLDDHNLRHLDLSDLRASMALVSQDSLLFNDTVANNIAFGRLDANQEDIQKAAKAAAADTFITALPDGYDTMVGEEGSRLSGGQRQRIAIARAMLRNAPILLLDEPTSALDSVTEEQIQNAMQILAKGRTTVIVAHRLATVRHADHILVIDGGKIVEQGNHEHLLAKGGVYANLYQSQHFY
ncbi:MAG: ABC transporter ATP-binding protein [Candidatus Puniceispirillales bacterium]